MIEQLRQSTSDDARFREKLEDYLNAGHGACLLREPAHAHGVEDALLHFDGQRYRLLAWVVMPNHVHVLIETQAGHPLPEVVHSWKSFTAKIILQALDGRGQRLAGSAGVPPALLNAGKMPALPLGRQGVLWQREYFDRYIRDERHLRAVIDYIDNNPVKAGLAKTAGDWGFGSARLGVPASRRLF